MRFSYKKLVDRFLIPRPTLIEWQKRVKTDKQNWRVKHLDYLREQVIVEELTLEELRSKPLLCEDIFLLSVFVFFNKNIVYINLPEFKKNLRIFAYANRDNVEYRHDFAKKVWSLKIDDGTGRNIANYRNLIEIIDTMTIAQFTLLMRKIVHFVESIEEKIKPSHTNLLDGLTWQELHMYDKAFNDKAIKKYFSVLGLNHQQGLFS